MTNDFSPKRLAGEDINMMSDRAAMNLPDHFVDLRWDGPNHVLSSLRHLTATSLVALVEDSTSNIATKYAAATLLGLVGDPRLVVLSPSMMTVPAARIRLGLDPGSIDCVMRQFADTRILRSWIQKESPTYDADIPTFRMGRFPVTNLEYRMFLASTAYLELPTSWSFGKYPAFKSNHPVFTVSSAAAEAYAQWLAALTGRRFRLPSEAEWEYAAGGPEGLEFPWGPSFDREKANTAEFGLFDSTPVGIFTAGASPFGILDMAGNVEEYTASDYAAYPGGEFVTDDLAASQGTYRVARGGSFTRFRDLCRTRRRHGKYDREMYVMGFRLAEDL